MKRLAIFALCLLSLRCSSSKPVERRDVVGSSLDARWARLFETDEKIRILQERGERRFQEAKRLTSRPHLEDARRDFEFLAREFGDTLAQQRLKEIERYEQNVVAYYQTAAQEALAQNNVADAAGYYKLLLRFDSSQTAAAQFLEQRQAEIEKEVQAIRDKGQDYLKKKQYVKAQKVYERLRLIAYSPDIDSALAQIQTLKAEQERKRKLAAKAAALSQKDEPITDAEREKIYAAAKRAFESKDYLKAYSLFSTLEKSYKDTALYLERAADKIEALKLNEDVN